MPKISIIIPVYNGAKFLDKTIQSVLAQTFADWELIIIDDQSTDNSRDIIKSLESSDQRIHSVFLEKNSGGPAIPKNIGLESAKGEFIAFLDQDDVWLPEKLEKQFGLFEFSNKPKLELVSCFVNIRDKEGKLLSQHNKNYRNDIVKHLTKINFLMTSSCIMVKREVFKKVGVFDSQFKVNDDWDMWLRIAEAGWAFDFVPEYLVNYISHGDNVSLKILNEGVDLEFLLVANKHQQSFLKYGPEVIGYYFFRKKHYKLSRKYYIRSIFSTRISFVQKIISLAYVILTLLPGLENILRICFKKFSD